MHAISKFILKIQTHFSSVRDVWLFIRIFLTITLLPALLKLFSLPRAIWILTPRDLILKEKTSLKDLTCDEQNKSLALHGRINKIVTYTDYILNHLFWVNKGICLRRSIVLYHFLRQIGMGVCIFIGVKYETRQCDKTTKKFGAHAWLVYRGDVFLERNPMATKTYRLIYSLPK